MGKNSPDRFNCFLMIPNGGLWHCLRGEYLFRRGSIEFDRKLQIFSNFGPHSLENTLNAFLEGEFQVTEVADAEEQTLFHIALQDEVPLNAEQFLLLAIQHIERGEQPRRSRSRRRGRGRRHGGQPRSGGER